MAARPRRRHLWLLGVALLALASALAGLGARATYSARTSADEPQYLLTAESLADDFSIDISDELARRTYLPYHEVTLDPQTYPLDSSGRQVSPHDPLLPALLAVPMAVAGWVGAKVALAAVAACCAALTAGLAHSRFGISKRVAVTVVAAGFTTTPKTPDEIHQIGLDEVARIRAEMLKIKDEVGFEGDLQAFFDHLRSDPKFFYSDPAELLKGYRGKLPRMPYGVRRIPEALAPHTYTAYYQPGANDGSRAGYYYVNLYKPEARPKWEMMALSLHEAVPGHHFQFALGLELPEQPMFRRTAYVVAYGEGWALYAERLGYEMGLYDDPYDRFGQLTYDMWRAVRLVVDTGMHAKGWSRQKAIDYFKANAPKTEQDIVNEIDRYIAWPGQALAYKIGQLKILELRARAEKALGGRFDLRAFHDQVLGTGSVPLAVLEQQVDRWIAAQTAAGAP